MILRRFLMGAGAQAWQRAVTIGAQVIVLPAMLHGWGPAAYGGRVALDSCRWFLAMSDLGLAQAAANRMTAEMAAGDSAGAARTGAAAWAMLAAAALAVGLGGALAGLFLPFGPILNLDRPAGEMGLAFFLLSLVAAGSILFGAVCAALRAADLFWLMSLANANFQLASAVAMAACALLGTGYVALALALVAAQGLSLGPVALWFLWRHPWARPGAARRRAAAADAGARAVLAALCAGRAPVDPGGQHPGRGRARAAGRRRPERGPHPDPARAGGGGGGIHPLEPLFAQCAGRADRAGARALARRLAVGGAALALLYALPMALFGPAFLAWWTGGSVTGHDGLHRLMTAAVAAEILWAALQTPYVATNRHAALAAGVAGAAVAALLACGLLLPLIGLAAAGWTLLAMQAAVLAQTLIHARRAPVL